MHLKAGAQMSSGFSWSFNKLFSKEFKNYPKDQQDKILEFLDIIEEHGIPPGEYSVFPGKLSVSWRGLDESHPNYAHAKSNHLWHYHLGLPCFKQSPGGFLTSDWLLHFQYSYGSNHIHLADTYMHKTSDNKFYLPSDAYLTKDVG